MLIPALGARLSRNGLQANGSVGRVPKRTPSRRRSSPCCVVTKVPAGRRSPKRWVGLAPVRGFLAGLSKKGVTVEVLERVRQVGPNKAGAKGSYTVYRVADASGQ